MNLTYFLGAIALALPAVATATVPARAQATYDLTVTVETVEEDLLVQILRDYLQATPYDFTVTVEEGSLAGNTFDGCFRYDDSAVQGIGTEVLGVEEGLTVRMNFLGQTYAETDDTGYPEFPQLVFEGGELQRLDFWIEPGDRLMWWDFPGWNVERSEGETCGEGDLPNEG